MKRLGSILFLISACTASTDNDMNGDGDGDPGVGNKDIRFRLTSVHDERGDQIDFSTGAPVHTHAGPKVQLGGGDCPDVYMHAYLMDAAEPTFGREQAPNPLAWNIEAKGSAEYRVRTGEDATVHDWTAVEGATIELHRDVITSGKYLLDVRVGNSVATTCFIMHPLAAPLEMEALQPDTTGLPGMTFAAVSPISKLFTGEQVPVYTQRIAHHTAEPVELAIEIAKPTGTYARRAVDEYVNAATVALTVVCSDGNGDYGEPICEDMSPLPAATEHLGAGPLTVGKWSLRVLDEATNTDAANCTVTPAGDKLRATCTLPARAPTGASQRYRLVVAASNLDELAPFGTENVAEQVLAGQPFTGRTNGSKDRCAQFHQITKFGVTIVSCVKRTIYARMQAIDTAKIDFNPVAYSLATSPSPALAPLPLAPQTVPAFTWDAGDADLPGPQ